MTSQQPGERHAWKDVATCAWNGQVQFADREAAVAASTDRLAVWWCDDGCGKWHAEGVGGGAPLRDTFTDPDSEPVEVLTWADGAHQTIRGMRGGIHLATVHYASTRNPAGMWQVTTQALPGSALARDRYATAADAKAAAVQLVVAWFHRVGATLDDLP